MALFGVRILYSPATECGISNPQLAVRKKIYCDSSTQLYPSPPAKLSSPYTCIMFATTFQTFETTDSQFGGIPMRFRPITAASLLAIVFAMGAAAQQTASSVISAASTAMGANNLNS